MAGDPGVLFKISPPSPLVTPSEPLIGPDAGVDITGKPRGAPGR